MNNSTQHFLIADGASLARSIQLPWSSFESLHRRPTQKIFYNFILRNTQVSSLDNVIKGRWWMVRLSEAMKDVPSCDKPGVSCTEALIPGCPNGATHLSEPQLSFLRKRTQ